MYVCSAIVSDLIRVIRIFNLENCDQTDFPVFRLSSDFALARVYFVTVHFDLSHCTCYGSVCCWLEFWRWLTGQRAM